MDPALQEWSIFLGRCLEQRVRAEQFEPAASQLYSKAPISGRKLAEVLLRPRLPSTNCLDPLVVVYLEHLLASRRFDASDVLIAAFKWSRDHPPKPGNEEILSKDDPSRWQNPPELEEIIFHRMQKAFSTGERPQTRSEARKTLAIVSQWMSAMVTAHNNDSVIQAMTGVQQPQLQSIIMVREALGLLIMYLIDNLKVIDMLNGGTLKGVFTKIHFQPFPYEKLSQTFNPNIILRVTL